MALPWWYHMQPVWTIYGQINDTFEEQELDIDTLKEKVRTLEATMQDMQYHIAGLEALLAAHGIVPPAVEENETPLTESPPVGTPAIFPARTEENIACPRCGKRQKGNRSACYSCALPFQYENE